MIAKLLGIQSKTIGAAALLLAGSALASRLLGLLRDRLFFSRFGPGEELDIYFAAFRIPDFIFGILIMGGFTAVFLPIFSEYFEKNKEEAFRMVSNLLNVLFFLLAGFSLILFVFMPLLIQFVTPGFSGEMRDATVPLARLMLLSPILLGVSAVFSGMLQYFGKFFVYSLAPVLYNLGIIAGILFFVPSLGLIGLAWGVVLGALLHILIQVYPALQSGFSFKSVFFFFDPSLIRMARLVAPRIVGAAAFHINLVVITALASTLAVGSIAVLSFASNLYFLPIGVVGISLATAAFPLLSRAAAKKDDAVFQENLLRTVRTIFFFIIPISGFMFLLRSHIVQLVLGAGELTAAVFGAFALGVFYQALVPLFARAFYALKDTKTPTLIGIGAVISNVGIAFLLLWVFSFPNFIGTRIVSFFDVADIKDIRVLALPLAISVSVTIQGFLLALFLKRKIGLNMRKISGPLNRIGISGLVMGGASFLALKGAFLFLPLDTFLNVLLQVIFVVTVGITTYLIMAKILKVEELNLLPFFRKKK
ncbi:murein biosynthesis integral membrane protein MurJ [Patescibacteria group bacterium]|nr:murein biosynthesis integral membrane protein MurJ [Patescibacteria group bacterium]